MAAPTMTVASGSLSDAQIAALAVSMFGMGPSDTAGVPAAVRATGTALAESGGNPRAVNPLDVGRSCSGSGSGRATGLYQIVPKCHPEYAESRLMDAAYNTWAASRISNRGTNWSQWTGRWERHRDRAEVAVATVRAGQGSSSSSVGGGLGLPIWTPPIPDPTDIGGKVIDIFTGDNPVADAAGKLDDLGALAASFSHAFSFVTDPDNIKRLLLVWFGVGLVTAGFLIINRDTALRVTAAAITGGGSEAAGAVGKAVT